MYELVFSKVQLFKVTELEEVTYRGENEHIQITLITIRLLAAPTHCQYNILLHRLSSLMPVLYMFNSVIMSFLNNLEFLHLVYI